MRRSRPERRFEQQAPTGDPPRRRGTSLQGDLYVVTQELAILRCDVRCFQQHVKGAPYREIRRRSSSYCEVTETEYIHKANCDGPPSSNQPPFARSNKSSCRRTQTQGDGPHFAPAPYKHPTTGRKPQDSGDGQHTPKPPRYCTKTQPGNEQHAPKDPSYEDKYRFGIARRILRSFRLKTALMDRGWQTERSLPSPSNKKLPENVSVSARSYYEMKEEPSSWSKMDMPILSPNAYKKSYDQDDEAFTGSERDFEFQAGLDFDAGFLTDQKDEDSFSSISSASFLSVSDLDTVDSDDFKSRELEQSAAIGPEFYEYWTPKKSSAERNLNIYEEQDKVKAAYRADAKTPRKPIEFVEPPCVATPRDTEPVDTSKGAIKKVGLQYFHRIPPPPEETVKLSKKRKKYVKDTADEKKIWSDGPPVVIADVVKRFFSTTYLKLMDKNALEVATTEPQGLKAKGTLSEPSLTVIWKPELPVSFPYSLEIPSEAKSHPFDFKSYMAREPNTRLVCKKEDNELIIYAIDRSNLGKNIFKAFELESYLLFPVAELPRTFPLDLSEVMSGNVPPNSTWQVLDQELVITSIYIFHRYSDLFPKNLYLLIADNLFTTVDGMLQFFEKDYVQLQEIHACMRIRPKSRTQREEQLDTLRLEAMTKESPTVRQEKRVEMNRVIPDEELQTMEYRRKQRQYIERLKPPCLIAPLPPRPRKWVPRLQSPEKVKKPPPPSKADLAYLQMCYEVHGCPKVVSAPRYNTPSVSGAEATPQQRRPTVSIAPPVRTGHRRREFVRAVRRRNESPSKGHHLDPDED